MENFKPVNQAVYEILIRTQLGNFLSLYEQAEENIEKKSRTLNNVVDSFIEKYQDEQKSEYEEIEFERSIDGLVDEMIPYTSYYPDILRKSLLVSIWAFYEHQLIGFCRKKEPTIIFKKDILDNARKYIKNEMKIDFPDQGKDWIFLKHVRDVRNNIVHEGAYVEEDSKLENVIKDHLKDINLSEDSAIVIESQFIPKLLSVIDHHLYNLFVEN